MENKSSATPIPNFEKTDDLREGSLPKRKKSKKVTNKKTIENRRIIEMKIKKRKKVINEPQKNWKKKKQQSWVPFKQKQKTGQYSRRKWSFKIVFQFDYLHRVINLRLVFYFFFVNTNNCHHDFHQKIKFHFLICHVFLFLLIIKIQLQSLDSVWDCVHNSVIDFFIINANSEAERFHIIN